MDEDQNWTPTDDEAVRGALGLLRRDVESLPLADVRFIRARGNARRRRALIIGVASAAAAVVAIGFVASNTVGSNQGLVPRPAGSNTAVTNTPSPSTPIAAPGPLLTAAEWQNALGFRTAVKVGGMRSGEGVSTCVLAPGAPLAVGWASVETPAFYAVQGTYRAASAAAGNTAAAFAVTQLLGCPELGADYKVRADAAWPKVFATIGTNGHRLWFIVAHHDALTSLVSIGDAGDPSSGVTTPGFSLDQIQAVALVAQQRLIQMEEGTTSPSASSTP